MGHPLRVTRANMTLASTITTRVMGIMGQRSSRQPEGRWMDKIRRQKEINEAVAAADAALVCLRQADDDLGSANSWGLFDLLGGGFIATAVKHGKIDDANEDLEQACRALRVFAKELGDVDGFLDVSVDDDGVLHFADYFFDGLVADWLVQSKIGEARGQVRRAIQQVEDIRGSLLDA